MSIFTIVSMWLEFRIPGGVDRATCRSDGLGKIASTTLTDSPILLLYSDNDMRASGLDFLVILLIILLPNKF